ncbi:MAG: molybdenum cofactor guanylyltransferase [Actinomycetota bacterium]
MGVIDGVLVLAGGESRRFGADKLSAAISRVTASDSPNPAGCLDHLLTEVRRTLPEVPIVVVGPLRHTTVPVHWTREEPPGGGPVAAVSQGIQAVLVDHPRIRCLAVLAGDQPFAAGALPILARTLGEQPQLGAVMARDSQGVPQPLLAVYQLTALGAALPENGAGQSMQSVIVQLAVTSVYVSQDATLDIDTPADLERAREQSASTDREGIS